MTGLFVLATIVEVTAESIPPETPITKPLFLDFTIYSNNQSDIYLIIALVCICKGNLKLYIFVFMRYILISFVLFFSCTSKYENKLEVYRFDIELFNSDSITIKDNLKYWNSKHASFMQMFSDEIMQKGRMSSNEYTKQ